MKYLYHVSPQVTDTIRSFLATHYVAPFLAVFLSSNSAYATFFINILMGACVKILWFLHFDDLHWKLRTPPVHSHILGRLFIYTLSIKLLFRLIRYQFYQKGSFLAVSAAHANGGSAKSLLISSADSDRVKLLRRKLCMIIFGMITMKSMLIILKGFDSAYVKQLLVHSGNIPYGKDKELQEYNKPRILCILLTHPGNYDKKAIHTQNTWARRCTNWSFISTTKHSKLRLLGEFKTLYCLILTMIPSVKRRTASLESWDSKSMRKVINPKQLRSIVTYLLRPILQRQLHRHLTNGVSLRSGSFTIVLYYPCGKRTILIGTDYWLLLN